MVDRLVAVNDVDYRLPAPVLGALATDMGNPASALGIQLNATIDEAVAPLIAGAGLQIAYHMDDAFFPRPDTESAVMWVGSVIPANRISGDVFQKSVAEEAPWTPALLDLLAWHEEPAGAAGSTVATIPDKSGRGNHLTVPGGTGVITVDTTALSRPGYSFAGDSWITSAMWTPGLWQGTVSVYVVASLQTDAVKTQTYFDGGSSAGRATIFRPTGTRLGIGQGGSNLFSASGVNNAGPALTAGVFTAGATTRGERNGVVRAGPGNAGSTVPDRHRLGASNTGTNMATAIIGEVIIARGVSEADHLTVTQYLMEKWGLV